MKKTFFLKIFAGYLAISIILTSLILFFTFHTVKTSYLETLTKDLQDLGLALQPLVIQLVNNNPDALDSLIKNLGKNTGTRITVIDSAGVVLADSEKDPHAMENHKTRPEVMQAFQHKIGSSMRYSTTVKEEMLYVALPLEQDGVIKAILRMSMFLKDINLLLSNLKIKIASIATFIIVLSLLGAVFFARSLASPIRQLCTASQQIASGDFSPRIFLKHNDELKELGDSFNDMAEQMNTMFAELSHQREALHAIIASLHEGLLVIDREDKIILCNDSFKNIVSDVPVEGKSYWEVARESQFAALLQRVRHEQKDIIEEITIKGSIYLCSMTFLSAREEIVVVFFDITEMKKLEKIKKDFVANVSHELRTPLTSIKGFVETMAQEANEQHKHWLAIIKKHTDRLMNIVQDLLVLSELEEHKMQISFKEVNLKKLIGDILHIYEQRAREKQLTVTLHEETQIPCIHADPFKLEQVFLNLIDNAIKYTEKGGVTITFRRQKGKAVIIISDTGIGIPEEHLLRIFERFYVVDKSRSRRLGGTGLGLSIVKHIVHAHNGEIDVESIPGAGTTFTITLPVNPF